MDIARKEGQERAAARLKELRARHRHTQQECADALGLEQPSYADMEGGRSRIRRRDLVTIADLYGIAKHEAFPEFFDAEPEGVAA